MLRRLVVRGPDKPDATLGFGPGFTLIAGISNTGKTHALECIDFALGASDPPKPIEESAGYTSVVLELSFGGTIKTISRTYDSHNVAIVFDGPIDAWDGASGHELKVASNPRKPDSTLNATLLEAGGFTPGTMIPRSAKGKTQMLSYRNVAPFAIVNEDEIIGDRSPVASTAPTSDVAPKAVFALMLTGRVPSAEVTAVNDANEARGNAKKRGALLSDMLAELQTEIAACGIERQVLEEQLAQLDADVSEITDAVLQRSTALQMLVGQRREALDRADKAQARHIESLALSERFELLARHYEADVGRLEFVLEGGHFFSQLVASHCPECGRPYEEGDQCHPESAHAAEVEHAARAELAKLQPRIADVQRAIAEAAEDAAAAADEHHGTAQQARDLHSQIREQASPEVNGTRAQLAELTTRRRIVEHDLLRYRELDRFVTAKQEADIAADAKPASFRATQDIAALKGLAEEIERVLVAWQFEIGSGVHIDAKGLDLVIGGKARGANGKGVRAITRAAFNIGLMRFCLANDRPHPGFVIIDTPLRPYKGHPPPGDEAEEARRLDSVRTACLRDLASADVGQVVMMENEDPPADIRSLAIVHEFRGGPEARRAGFYPE
jgi:uncharacterized Zn finger protein (UPF0148 family)